MSRPTNTPEDYIGPCGCDEARDPWTRCDVCEANGWTPPTDDPATLRARLQERYGRPERPCTYDPDGGLLWTEKVRAALESPPMESVFVVPRAFAKQLNRELAAVCAMPERYDPADEEPEAEPVADREVIIPARSEYTPGPWVVTHINPSDDWTPPRPEPVEYAVAPQGGPDPINPADILYPCECGARGIHACPLATRYPSDMFAPPRDASARADEILRHPLTGTSTWGTLTLPPGGDAFDPKPSFGRVNWINHVVEDPSNGPRLDDSMVRFMERVRTAGLLRSYLRTLTNPDATPEDVNAALDALTPADRALVSEAIPSWGSARMSRVEAIAPFMDRFDTMVRERDPRAHEEGTLLLSALREDDPTRSTVEALMEIAKTPKASP